MTAHLTANSKNSAIVHADFAEKNGLAVGDEIGVEINGGKSISLTIIGLYRAGNERKQDEDTLAVHRIENQVFIDNTAYTELFGEDDFYKVAVYTDAPEYLETLSEDLQTLLGDKTSIKGSDALYRQMKAPLEQITKVVELMLILTFVTGTVVISLLLCMWTRTRQKENQNLPSSHTGIGNAVSDFRHSVLWSGDLCGWLVTENAGFIQQ